jgi:hypothetical protein
MRDSFHIAPGFKGRPAALKTHFVWQAWSVLGSGCEDQRGQ